MSRPAPRPAPAAGRGADHAASLIGVRFAYPGHAVFSELGFAVADARVTALLGRNGSGKTTILNLLLGWLRPEEGVVEVFDRPVASRSRREMGRLVSLLPQDEHVPFEYTVLEYALLGRTPHLPVLGAPTGDDVQVARAALRRLDIEPLAAASVANLSGGERQLAMLARSLTQEPRMLLLDEPTAHLDPARKRELADLLREFAAEGRTILLTTHDPEFAAACADRVALLSAGEVFAHGTPAGVLTSRNLERAFGVSMTVSQIAGRTVVLW